MTATTATWLAELRQRLLSNQERRLVWVQGSAAFALAWARAATAGIDGASMLFVSDAASGAERIRPDQAKHYLGREFSVLVWDARAGLHPDGLGALGGTLRGGGVLILLTPEGENWHRFDDPDYRRLASKPAEKYFLARMARILAATPSVLSVTEDNPLPPLPILSPAVPMLLPTSGQTDALAAIIKVRRGHRRRPLVITADRGRGKSSVLGIAAAELLTLEGLDIIVTAPRPSALGAFWEHASANLPGGVLEPGCLRPGQGQDQNRGSIQSIPPARLLETLPRADLLLVDEAAAIPVPILAGLLKRYARVVFASTVHGYEGSGRGFALRFQAHLTAVAPHWRALTLTQPVRWAATDPLEPLLNQLLLLNAELADVNASTASVGEPELTPWPRPARAGDERRLAEVFGLLVNAHYQTTPDDLRLLLDDENSHCWLALWQGRVAGAAWVMAEGGLPEPLARAVRRGERRARGHLLPQALAAYGADTEAATLRYWRLVRVAVHPHCRRRGVGRRLVAMAARSARAAGADVFGTSFGVNVELVAFWQGCGLQPLRLGLRRDAASGAPSMMLGEGLTGAGKALCQRQRHRFTEHWPTLLTTELRILEPALVWLLNACWPPRSIWTDQDLLEVADFAAGFRPLALTRLPLQRLTWQQPRVPQILGDDAALWCRAILQQAPENEWRAQGLVSGRKEGYARLQRAACQLISVLPGTVSGSV